MRLYSMQKGEFVMVFLAFFCCLGLSVFIGLAGPPITKTTHVKGSSALEAHNISYELMDQGPFPIQSPLLSVYRQQLWVITVVQTSNNDDEVYEKPFQVSITIEGISSEKRIAVLRADRIHNRTRHLHCAKRSCEPVTVAHLGYLYFSRYLITVRFYGLQSFHKLYHIREINFFFKSYNPGFTQIEMWFRLIFLMATFGVTCWFSITLRTFSVHDWSIEQKWMSVLLPLLMLYNNPIFALTFLMDSWIPGMLDALFQASFLCSLLLFWLCIYHGLRQNERRLLTFYLPKLLIVGPVWLCAVIMATWQKYNEHLDPTYSYQLDTSYFYNFKMTFFLFLGLYITYLLCLILRAYSELRSMPFFDMRLKFVTLLMLIVLSISMSITVSRFGLGVLEDNFVADLSTNYASSAQFMACYGLLNFYLYTMTYVYSPSKKTIFETGITKDNPAFSMINDSDEDVIYGSDEESRQPLNRSRNEDDSD
ncbi:transmembrane protein 181-like isoform X2 [Macrosteles quadrilineatus]|nr:transmembrane protein 181-like isoform X2 [Macrosteles quadrilineatus]